jgi:hypothetical protein
MKSLSILLIGVIFISCDSNNPVKQNKVEYAQNASKLNTVNSVTDLDQSIDTTEAIKDYVSMLDSMRIFFGTIQNENASKNIYPIGSCNNTNQFEMIWVPKNRDFTNENLNLLTYLFKEEKLKGFPSFNIIVIEVPKLAVTELEDEFSMGLITPSTAKIFVRLDNQWRSWGQKKIKNFIDFTNLENEIVKKIDTQKGLSPSEH